MRSIKEILEKAEHHEGELFGFISSDLMGYLDFKNAIPFLKEEYVNSVRKGKEKWKPEKQQNVIREMKKYMEFALGKALDHRGLSASRSIEHYKVWVWLLGDGDYEKIAWDDYRNYGMPILRQICEKYNFTFPTNDKMAMRMSEGELCTEDCEEGCAS